MTQRSWPSTQGSREHSICHKSLAPAAEVNRHNKLQHTTSETFALFGFMAQKERNETHRPRHNGVPCRLPSADINPVARVDASGSTELLTNYLATDSGWSLGVGKTVTWPKCVKQVQGTDGILAYLASQPFAIG